MLEAIHLLRSEGLSADMVKAVTVTTHPRWLAVCNQLAPTTGLGAKFSYRLTAAMGLAGVETAALDTFQDAMTQRPDLLALRDRVTIVTDVSLADTQACVTVATNNDGMREMFHDLAAATDSATLERRLRYKSSTLLGAEASDLLWQAVNTIDDAKIVSAFASQLAR